MGQAILSDHTTRSSHVATIAFTLPRQRFCLMPSMRGRSGSCGGGSVPDRVDCPAGLTAPPCSAAQNFEYLLQTGSGLTMARNRTTPVMRWKVLMTQNDARKSTSPNFERWSIRIDKHFELSALKWPKRAVFPVAAEKKRERPPPITGLDVLLPCRLIHREGKVANGLCRNGPCRRRLYRKMWVPVCVVCGIGVNVRGSRFQRTGPDSVQSARRQVALER